MLLCIAFAAGCTAADQDPSIVTVSGSTTVLPIAALAAEKFMDLYPEIDVQVSGGGSGVGVQAAGEGTVMIGMSSRDVKAAEKEMFPDLVEYAIAMDGIAIITHPSNPIESLTLDQIKEIYEGKITNWSEVGGESGEIVLVGRDSASGTREFFYTDVMKSEDFAPSQLEKGSNGALKQTIEQTPTAIGYVSIGYLDDTIHTVALDIDGEIVLPTVETIKAGEYPISRPLYLLTSGEPTGPTADFISFLIDTPDGKEIISEEGFLPFD
jgi:phosphate transport system substrate-binding protein